MPIVRTYLPSYAAAGEVALAGGQGLFEQKEDAFQNQQEQFAAQLGERARQFDVRSALQARPEQARAQQAQQQTAARLLANQQDIAARQASDANRFRQQQLLEAQRQSAYDNRATMRLRADALLKEQQYNREQQALLDEREAEKAAAKQVVDDYSGAMEAQLDAYEEQLPGDPSIARWRDTVERARKTTSAYDPRFSQRTWADIYKDFQDENFEEKVQRSQQPEITAEDLPNRILIDDRIPGEYFIHNGTNDDGLPKLEPRTLEQKEEKTDHEKLRKDAIAELKLSIPNYVEGQTELKDEDIGKKMLEMEARQKAQLGAYEAAKAELQGSVGEQGGAPIGEETLGMVDQMLGQGLTPEQQAAADEIAGLIEPNIDGLRQATGGYSPVPPGAGTQYDAQAPPPQMPPEVAAAVMELKPGESLEVNGVTWVKLPDGTSQAYTSAQ